MSKWTAIRHALGHCIMLGCILIKSWFTFRLKYHKSFEIIIIIHGWWWWSFLELQRRALSFFHRFIYYNFTCSFHSSFVSVAFPTIPEPCNFLSNLQARQRRENWEIWNTERTRNCLSLHMHRLFVFFPAITKFQKKARVHGEI